MGLLGWWRARKERQALVRESVRISEDPAAIAEHAPELVGMSFVEGGAYIMRAIDEFNETATPEQSAMFAGRLIASQQAWADDGLTMPYWANLWILRTLQTELREWAVDS